MIFLQLKEPKEVYNGNVCTVCPRNFIHSHEAYLIAKYRINAKYSIALTE